MAEKAKEEEVDYESDPEETKLSLKMRRREASDDEEEGEGREEKMNPNRRMVESDVDSDSQGAAAEYDDEEGEDEEYVEEEEELIEEDEEYVEEGVEYEERGGEAGPLVDAEGGKHRGEGVLGVEDPDGRQDLDKDQFNDKRLIDDPNGEEEEGVEEKKENEPYAVPTAGAFYMHDDRFRDNAAGRNRRTFGGRKLWESKDEKKWGHDKFEELTFQERRYDEGRRSFRGRYRGRGRTRGPERVYAQGNSPRGYNTTYNPNKNVIHSNASRSVRGRGQRRYQQSSFKSNSEAPSSKHQQPGKSAEKSSYSVSARTFTSQPNVEAESALAKRNTFGSSLNSASPPFYPSGSSSKDVPLTQKGDGHPVTTNRGVHHSVADQSFSMVHPAPVQRGKAVVDSMGMDKLYIDNSLSPVAGKPSVPLQSAVSSSTLSSSQSLQLRGQGRGINSLPRMAYQPTGSASQVNRFPPPASHSTMQRNQVTSRGHSPGQQFGQNSRGGSQGSSPPKASHDKSSSEAAEVESPSESMNSKTSLVSKGKGNIQNTGRASLLYGGAQVMGSPGNLGDQNFPAFLPVMQFGGQHPGGVGVPAVGMAFPGYVGQPQLGGNSEMTWLPVLAGAAGALGAAYGSPYIAIDGAYHGRPSGQTSSLPPAIKESNANKPNNDSKPPQRLEVSNDDFGHRQKNPRRYTEMKFDH